MRTKNTQLSGQAHKTSRMLTLGTLTERDPHSFRLPQFPIRSGTKSTQRGQKLASARGAAADETYFKRTVKAVTQPQNCRLWV